MKEDFRFYHPIRVRYAEIDGQKIVFNGVYLTYMDVAFTEYLRNLGIILNPKIGHNFDFAVVKTTLEFKKPAYFDEVLNVYCRVPRIGSKSFSVAFEIYREDSTLCLVSNIIYVGFDPAAGRSVEVPAFFRSAIERFEGGLAVEGLQQG